MVSRVREVLTRCETSTYSEAYDSSGDNSDGQSDDGDSYVKRCNSLVLGRKGPRYQQAQKQFLCRHNCKAFTRRQDLVRHYLRRRLLSIRYVCIMQSTDRCYSDLKCKRPCSTCSKAFPTANKFLAHECFRKASVDQQQKQFALFRKEIEEEFNLQPRNHRTTRRLGSLHPVDSIISPPPTSVQNAVHGDVSSNASLPQTSELLFLQKSNHLDSSPSVYNNTQPFSHPLGTFDAQQNMMLTYVNNMLIQPQDINDWSPSNFPRENEFSSM